MLIIDLTFGFISSVIFVLKLSYCLAGFRLEACALVLTEIIPSIRVFLQKCQKCIINLLLYIFM